MSGKRKVLVVGGGAAGMMAAIAAADAGSLVVLYEKNEKLGKKLFLTGKGRCNVTNASDVEMLLSNVTKNAKFLYSAFYSYDSFMLMEQLENEGLPLKTERGNRVFPVSDKSSDVIKTLENMLSRRGVQIFLNTPVKELLICRDSCQGVLLETGQREMADAVILATGGVSYPSTGSTGDGYGFAKGAGLSVEKPFPSLVPFVTKEDYIPKMQGLSLKNVVLSLYRGKKRLYEEQGELLFTHFGVSGPLVLTASTVLSGSDVAGITGRIDLKPALDEKTLDDRILRDFGEAKNALFKNSLGKLLPAKMIPVVVRLSEISQDKRVNEVTKDERLRLLKVLKEFPFTVEGLRGFAEAIITRGGVSVKEINPGTMEAKKVGNLFFAGEVIDLDAKTGGFNLQIAWSTGYLAGRSAAECPKNAFCRKETT